MSSSEQPQLCELDSCPVCAGKMVVVYDRYHQKVCVCVDCNTGVTIPGSAWEVKKLKGDGKWPKTA